MSAWWQFRALIRKNIQTLKRSPLMTALEIFYPVILMLIGYLIKIAFNSTKVTWEEEKGLEQYLVNKGNFGFDYTIYPHVMNYVQLVNNGIIEPFPVDNYLNHINVTNTTEAYYFLKPLLENVLTFLPSACTWDYIDPLDEHHDINLPSFVGLPNKPLTMICYNRFTIAFVGFSQEHQLSQIFQSYFGIEMTSLGREYSYKYFDTNEELDKYIKAENYGLGDNPTICFAIYYKETVVDGKTKYSASLRYFADPIQHGIEDVPDGSKPVYEEMQQGPNMEDVKKYSDNGYVQVMNIIANYILKKEKGMSAYINYGFALQKYDSYKFNDFSAFAGIYFTFFAILSYLCPLILYVLKMVVEKESKAKEVMKIMGMGEFTYFLSYFVEYFIVNIIYGFAVGLIAKLIFYKIPYLYLVLYLWLFGLNIYALAFFCQSFMETTRLSLIVSCLVYCLMFFVSAAVYDRSIKKTYKILAAFLPPVNLLLGAFTLGEFERLYYTFETKHVNKNFVNYSMATCYIMFTVDFFIYILLGYYLQNVVPREYGVQKPFYYIFMPSYWFGSCSCCNKEENESKKKIEQELEKPDNTMVEMIDTEKIKMDDNLDKISSQLIK